MARSSGGGSRSGGSRSSSSRSGGGFSSSRSSGRSGGSLHRIRKKPFLGARHFRYYRNDRQYDIYSDTDLRNQQDQKPRWILMIFYIPFLLALISMASNIQIFPEKPLKDPSIADVKIIDNANIFNDEEETQLLQQVANFSDTTGIKTQILTVKYEDWAMRSFSSYALDMYYTRFYDEKGWLIVYSEYERTSEHIGTYIDWEWEGIQGDETVEIMDVFIDNFNQTVQSTLTSQNNEPKFNAALMQAFDRAIYLFENQKINIDFVEIFAFLFFAGFLCVHCGVMVFAGTNLRYSNQELIEIGKTGEVISPVVSTPPPQSTQQIDSNDYKSRQYTNYQSTLKCGYCGYEYQDPKDNQCPNCGAIL